MSNQSLTFSIGGNFQSLTNSLQGWAGRIGGIVAGAFSAAAVAQFAQGVLEAGSSMEVFEGRLTTLMGSSKAAKARLEELYAFAANTPFELDQIVAAEVTLRGFGAAAEELMPGLIDFAATTGADMSQAAIDIGKAWSQGATGLESDFGRVLRKQLEMREGMDATKMSLDDFREALLSTLNEGMTAGGAERLARSYSGMMSTLKDEWTGFQRQVADAGLFDNVKAGLAETLTIIGDNRDAIKELAGDISTGLWWSIKGATYLVGALATGVDGIGIAGAVVLSIFADMGADLLTMTQWTRDLAKELAGATGNERLASGVRAMDGLLNDARISLEFIRIDAAAWAENTALSETPLQRAVDLIARIEASAEAIKDDTAATTFPTPPKAPGADAGGKATEDPYLKQLNAATAFYADVMAMDDTYYEQITARYGELTSKADLFYESGVSDHETYVESKLAIDNWYAGELATIDAQIAEERRRQHEDELKRIEDQRAAQLAAWDSQLGAVSGILSSISSLYDEENEKQKAAHKRFALASIIVDTAAGVMRAFAQFGWPGGLLPAGQVLLAGAVQGATVAKAHQGGIIGDIFPDEADVTFGPGRRVRTLRGESVSVGNTQTARAMQDANRTNGATVGGTQVIELHVGRVAQREIIRTDVASGGTIPRYVSDRISRGTRTAGWAARGAPL